MRSVQPGQYPQQPYPPQQYPGYPGYPPPKRGNTTLVVVLVIVGVLVVAGLGVGAYFLFSNGDDKAPVAAGTTKTSATPTSKAAPPDKYSKTPGCSTIAGRMEGMPPLKQEDGPEPAGSSDPEITAVRHFCTWSKDGSSRGDVSMYLYQSKVPGSGAGEAYAKGGFDGASGKPVTGIGKATKAVQKDYPDNGLLQCGIEFYQGNFEAEVIVSAADKNDTNKERCLANAKKLAAATSEAMG